MGIRIPDALAKVVAFFLGKFNEFWGRRTAWFVNVMAPHLIFTTSCVRDGIDGCRVWEALHSIRPSSADPLKGVLFSAIGLGIAEAGKRGDLERIGR
ncbi:MAG: hypothetical protein M2R45_05144 [Verrucomicrobia subdivision 3 bacterium]|nr:hypothetical protein [Limisphaerales bacterium]MCS1417206.1 hypothetical protein [Limisphaerales bacterium]